MTIKHLSLFLVPLLFSCGGENAANDTNSAIETNDTIAVEKTTDIEEAVPLFDMHPEVKLNEFDGDSELMWPNIKYFTGNIGGESIDMILNKSYKDRVYKGRYLYQNNGSSFEVEATLSQKQDSITIIRMKDNAIRETFMGSCNEKLTSINGVWIKSGDSKEFSLTEQINSPQQVQIFMNASIYGDFYNTVDGIAMIPGYSGNDAFNSFTLTDSEGTAGDFGEEWGDQGFQVFFEDSLIICVETDLLNSVSTVFKEGHEPDGPEYNDPDGVEGIEYSIYGDMIITVIDGGVKTSDTLKVSQNFTADTWLFKHYIVLSDHESDKTIIYKWNRVLETFEEQ